MANFIQYETPKIYSNIFNEYSTHLNLKNANIICALIFGISILSRVVFIISLKDISRLKAFDELSINNYLQIICSCLFFILTYKALRNRKISLAKKKILVIAFICYLLTAAYMLSYIISRHNTKNTLAALLMGIFMVGLFFSIERKETKIVLGYFLFIYFLGMFFSGIALPEKLANGVSALLMSIVLYSSSRYNYYIKSNQFVQIKQLEEKNKEILRLDTQKNDILSFVAHDLRVPLNNIDALSQILLLEDGSKHEMKMISSSALQAKNIINDLIEAVKANQPELIKESIDLKPYINKIIEKWQANTNRKINFVQDNDDLMLQANASKLERVIDNLIGNAFKFSASNSPINVTVSNTQDKALISVRDFGIGIPSELQPHVFEQFSKAGRQGLQGEKSIGLGLHISHKIIEQHGGELLLESKENEGTTFTIQLPLTDI